MIAKLDSNGILLGWYLDTDTVEEPKVTVTQEVWQQAIDINANKYVDEQAPWSLKKSDFSRMEDVLYTLLETVRQVSILLQPFMPDSSKAILDHLKVVDDERDFKSLGKMYEGGINISTPLPLFPRIN